MQDVPLGEQGPRYPELSWPDRVAFVAMGLIPGAILAGLVWTYLTGYLGGESGTEALVTAGLTGLALAVAAGFWGHRWHGFRGGRALVLALLTTAVLLGLHLRFPLRPQTPVQSVVTDGHFDPRNLHILGVAPGMTRSQVASLLGPPDSERKVPLEAAGLTLPGYLLESRYARLDVIVLSDPEQVCRVEGPQLSLKSACLVRVSQPVEKARDVLGAPRSLESTPREDVYSQWDPAFSVKHRDGLVERLSLSKR